MANARSTERQNDESSEEANRADVVEQRAELDESEDQEPQPQPDDARSRGEASEADTVEQLREVDTDEDTYR